MSKDKISELILSNAPDSPFAKNPMYAYKNTVDQILGGSFEAYRAKVLGERPETNSVGFFGETVESQRLTISSPKASTILSHTNLITLTQTPTQAARLGRSTTTSEPKMLSAL
jgi:hypothetical protein